MKLSYLVFLAGYEVFRAVSILAVAYSDLSVGLMLAIFSYLWVMVSPTQDIINFQYVLATAKAACKRINTIFEMEQEPVVKEEVNPFASHKAVDIEVKNLWFSYKNVLCHSRLDRESSGLIGNKSQDPRVKPEDDAKEENSKNECILKNINMRIEAGSKVAVVGASGSGKTTLANILNGFYPLKEGEIYYGGVSNHRLQLSTIRENIYLILQHPKLFNDTMRFNLTLGNDHSDEEIAKAIEIAQLESVIERLEHGLETLVGKDGIKLSGGQRQRVAIARMVLANPKVVIFDESTSALDVHTEAKLFEALHSFLEEKTVITIAHRLSTIKSAAFIYVLEEGHVVDSGTPEELLKKDESYFSRMI
jgi:ATP-binding cassette subfamily C protein